MIAEAATAALDHRSGRSATPGRPTPVISPCGVEARSAPHGEAARAEPTGRSEGTDCADRVRAAELLVLINDGAGSSGHATQTASDLRAAFAKHSIVADVRAIDAGDLEAEMVAHAKDVRAIVVGGGDGTVNAAAAVALAHDLVIGVLPLGTLNHFARDLGVPLALTDAVAWLARAAEARIDVASVNGRVFVNNLVIGAYPRFVTYRDALRRERGWGKVRATPVAVARTWRRLPVRDLTLRTDGGDARRLRTPLLFVGNGMFDDHGERVGDRTSLTDHRLGIYVLSAQRPWELLAAAAAARLRGVVARRLDRWEAQEALIDADAGQLSVAVDGETTTTATPLVVRTHPGALRVLVAPSS